MTTKICDPAETKQLAADWDILSKLHLTAAGAVNARFPSRQAGRQELAFFPQDILNYSYV
jgi:hypothetical protein